MNYGGACESRMRRQRGEQKGGDLDYRILEDLRFLFLLYFSADQIFVENGPEQDETRVNTG